MNYLPGEKKATTPLTGKERVVLDTGGSVINYAALQDVANLAPNGQMLGFDRMLFALLGANMNSIADQPFVPLFTFSTFLINDIFVTQASGALSGAIGGIYPAAAKGGVPLVAASQSYAAITGPTSRASLNQSAAATALMSVISLFLSLSTPLGSPATANIYITGRALG